MKQIPSTLRTVANLIAFFLTDSNDVPVSQDLPWIQGILKRAESKNARYNCSLVGVLLTMFLDANLLSNSRFYVAQEGSASSFWTESTHEVIAVMFCLGSHCTSQPPVDPRSLTWVRADYMENLEKYEALVKDFISISHSVVTELGWQPTDSFFASAEEKISGAFGAPFRAGRPYNQYVLLADAPPVGDRVWVDQKSGSQLVLTNMEMSDIDQLSALSTVPYSHDYYEKLLSPPYEQLSSAIRLEEDRSPISWCFTHAYDLSLGLLSTREEWRGRGLGLKNLLHVIPKQLVLYSQHLDKVLDQLVGDGKERNQLHAALSPRLVPYGYVTVDNFASQAVMRKAGFVPQQEFQWIWIEPEEDEVKQ
ncbi:hypothetical protein BJ742DRAFT_842287 [Cladochytrium replicatum]|nr:hypothetical protein BJ742DRAFT_842287 [Cladochytrium replicatum]